MLKIYDATEEKWISAGCSTPPSPAGSARSMTSPVGRAPYASTTLVFGTAAKPRQLGRKHTEFSTSRPARPAASPNYAAGQFRKAVVDVVTTVFGMLAFSAIAYVLLVLA